MSEFTEKTNVQQVELLELLGFTTTATNHFRKELSPEFSVLLVRTKTANSDDSYFFKVIFCKGFASQYVATNILTFAALTDELLKAKSLYEFAIHSAKDWLDHGQHF